MSQKWCVALICKPSRLNCLQVRHAYVGLCRLQAKRFHDICRKRRCVTSRCKPRGGSAFAGKTCMLQLLQLQDDVARQDAYPSCIIQILQLQAKRLHDSLHTRRASCNFSNCSQDVAQQSAGTGCISHRLQLQAKTLHFRLHMRHASYASPNAAKSCHNSKTRLDHCLGTVLKIVRQEKCTERHSRDSAKALVGC